MIDVYRVRFTKAELAGLQADQRNALLVLGHASNQLAVQFKALHFSLNNDVKDEVQQTVAAGQSQIHLRQLVGLIFETWGNRTIHPTREHPAWCPVADSQAQMRFVF